jgi:hypothetical protein
VKRATAHSKVTLIEGDIISSLELNELVSGDPEMVFSVAQYICAPRQQWNGLQKNRTIATLPTKNPSEEETHCASSRWH